MTSAADAPRRFPLLLPRVKPWAERRFLEYFGQDWLPWEMLAPHEHQAMSNHGGQSLERLASRGGLSPLEAVLVLLDVTASIATIHEYNQQNVEEGLPRSWGLLRGLHRAWLATHKTEST